MTHSRFLLFFIGGFFGGVLLASFGLVPNVEILMGMAILFLFFGVGRFRGGFFFDRFRRAKFFVILVAIVFGLWSGWMRFWLGFPNFAFDDIATYRDLKNSVAIEGIMTSEPDIRSTEQYLVLDTDQLILADPSQKTTARASPMAQRISRPIHGKVQIKAQRYPVFAYGDRLRIRCFLETPQNYDHYLYAQVLAKDGIYTLCNRPIVTLIAHDQGNLFWADIFWLKSILLDRINQLFPEPEASIVAGVLVGARRSIPQAILDDFSRTGLSHVLAISGYNINIMIAVFGVFFRSSGRKTRFVAMLVGIIIFLLFTGFSGSVIRAAWMAFFVLLAKVSGRQGSAFQALIWSAFVMVMLNPYVLAFDLSFELSFLATLGLVTFMPHFEKYFEKYNEKHPQHVFSRLPAFISEGFWVTIAAQIFTTPLILYYFGRFSMIAPLPNVLFLPLIPWIMLFSFLALVLVLPSFSIFFLLATPFTALTWICLKLLLGGVALFAAIPFASIQF